MVSQREDNAASLPEAPDFEAIAAQMEAEGDFLDSTPADEPEEAPVEATEEVTEEVTEPEAEPEEQPESQTSEPETEAEPQPSESVASAETEQRTKLTDIPEFREWQSQRDRAEAQLRKQLEELTAAKQSEQQREQVNQQVEDHLKQEVQRLSNETGYSSEDVERAVRDPNRVQQVRAYYEQQQKLSQYERAIDLAGRREAMRVYSQKYNVPEADRELLMSASSPEHMESLAKRFGQPAEQPERKPARRVPAEDPETAPVQTRSDGPTKRSFDELLESTESKEYGDMDAEERAAVDAVYRGQIPG